MKKIAYAIISLVLSVISLLFFRFHIGSSVILFLLLGWILSVISLILSIFSIYKNENKSFWYYLILILVIIIFLSNSFGLIVNVYFNF